MKELLHSLQRLLDEYCSCYHSYLPALRSPDQSHDSADEEREIDSDVIRSDVIKVLSLRWYERHHSVPPTARVTSV